jgi:hypothetical protein
MGLIGVLSKRGPQLAPPLQKLGVEHQGPQLAPHLRKLGWSTRAPGLRWFVAQSGMAVSADFAVDGVEIRAQHQRSTLNIFAISSHLRYNLNMANGPWGSKEDVDSRAPRIKTPKPAKPKGGSAIVVGACLIAAVKIAQDRGPPASAAVAVAGVEYRSWDMPAHSPKITATISTALTIAKKIYDRTLGTFPELF